MISNNICYGGDETGKIPGLFKRIHITLHVMGSCSKPEKSSKGQRLLLLDKNTNNKDICYLTKSIKYGQVMEVFGCW